MHYFNPEANEYLDNGINSNGLDDTLKAVKSILKMKNKITNYRSKDIQSS